MEKSFKFWAQAENETWEMINRIAFIYNSIHTSNVYT